MLADELAAVDLACSRFRADSELVRAERAAGHDGRRHRAGCSRRCSAALDVAALHRRPRRPDRRRDAAARGLRPHVRRDPPPRRPPRPGLVRARCRLAVGRRSTRADAAMRVPAGVELDLGATAKALAADRAAAAVSEATGAGVLVGLGGDVAVAGEPPEGGWPVRIADDHAAPARRPGPRRLGRLGRARQLGHARPPLGELRRRAPPHHRPAHRPARRHSVAHGQRRRDVVRRTRTRPARPRSCSATPRPRGSPAPPAGAARRRGRRRRGRRRLAGGDPVTSGHALWYLTRGSGAVVAAAADRHDPARRPQPPALAQRALAAFRRRLAAPEPDPARARLHRHHVGTTLADGYAPVGVKDVFIPFTSQYRPIWVGLGALAFDLLLALTVTSMLRKHIGYRTWRALHWAAYASWPIALAHGLGSGSDARFGWMALLSFGSMALVLGRGRRPPRPQRLAGTPARRRRPRRRARAAHRRLVRDRARQARVGGAGGHAGVAPLLARAGAVRPGLPAARLRHGRGAAAARLRRAAGRAHVDVRARPVRRRGDRDRARRPRQRARSRPT